MNVLHRKYIHKKDKKRVLQQKSLQQRACASIKVRYFFLLQTRSQLVMGNSL